MDYIIEQRLTNIENLAKHQQDVSQEILRCVQRIYGYCAGMEAVASDYPPAPKQLYWVRQSTTHYYIRGN